MAVAATLTAFLSTSANAGTVPFSAELTVVYLRTERSLDLGSIEGQATQMGQVTGEVRDRSTAGGTRHRGSQVLEDPNGDTLVASYEFEQVGNDASGPIFEGTFTIEGGSGRFEGATGSGQITVTSTPDPGLHHTLEVGILSVITESDAGSEDSVDFEGSANLEVASPKIGPCETGSYVGYVGGTFVRYPTKREAAQAAKDIAQYQCDVFCAGLDACSSTKPTCDGHASVGGLSCDCFFLNIKKGEGCIDCIQGCSCSGEYTCTCACAGN